MMKTMQSPAKHFHIWVSFWLLFSGCYAWPVIETTKDDLIGDEMKVEFEREVNNVDDMNPFDRLERVNQEKDVTDLYQGDIKKMADAVNEKRNAVNDKTKLWIGKVVPYTIDSQFAGDVKSVIESALEEIRKVSCLTFKQRQNENHFLSFIKDNGCWSYVGRYLNGVNKISIGNGCEYKGIVIHEVLHALGFWHEQSRADRGKHIEINWENIQQGVEYNFQKNTEHERLTVYDYDSIMHYGPYAFTANGKKTIVPIKDPTLTIGQRNGLSAMDITELNVLYDCQSNSTDFYSTWGNWQPCDSYCYKSRQRFCSHTDLTKCPLVDQNGVETQTAPCSHAECYPKIDGHWGKWSAWSTCTKTCGDGMSTRSRTCNNPLPQNGGNPCVGAATDTSSCKAKSCFLGPSDCEFETGFCAWTNETSADQLNWILRSGSTPSVGTGPTGDHTSFGKGTYIYMEASSPAMMGQVAVLNSKTLKKSTIGTKCLKFWYHMYGLNMGSLTVVQKDILTMAETELVKLLGNKGNQWNQQKIDVVAANDFQIKLKAERGSSYESDIAVDDIYLTDGSCNPINNPLGMEDKRIKDYQISSSSDWDSYHRPQFARLNNPAQDQWCAHWQKHGTDQFVRVDFDKRQLMYGVSVQGQASFDNWVTSYKVNYTEDGYIWKTYMENGIDKIFTGPTSRNTPVKHNFASPIHGFGLLVNPQSFHGNDICLRMEIYGNEDPSQPAIPAGCSAVVAPLGMASGKIADSQITATSIWDSNHQAYNARLNGYKVWCSSYSVSAFEHIQIDVGKVKMIHGIATQGHPTWDNYVTSYEVAYSENGNLFYDVLGDMTSFTKRIFTGNMDRHSIVKHKFDPPLKARFIRIVPKAYIGNDICLRAELYGCE